MPAARLSAALGAYVLPAPVADLAESEAAAEPVPIAEMEVEAAGEVAAADAEAAAAGRVAKLLRRLRAAHDRNRRLRRDVRRLEKQVALLQEPRSSSTCCGSPHRSGAAFGCQDAK